jgi:hypothetical protein
MNKVAEDLGISRRTLAMGRAVADKATPEVEQAVQAGEISVKKGAEIAQLPREEQDRAVKQAKAPKPPKPEVEDTQYFCPTDEEIAQRAASASRSRVPRGPQRKAIHFPGCQTCIAICKLALHLRISAKPKDERCRYFDPSRTRIWCATSARRGRDWSMSHQAFPLRLGRRCRRG